MARGGYQKPTNPAPVGMPGAMSRRTDGGPADTQQVKANITGGDYGDTQEFDQMQSSAPMSASARLQPGKGSSARPMRTPPPAPTSPADAVPFNAPSTMPNEPLTSGAPFGPGSTPPVLTDEQQAMEYISPVIDYMPMYRWAADQPDASPLFRSYIRWMDAMIAANGGA